MCVRNGKETMKKEKKKKQQNLKNSISMEIVVYINYMGQLKELVVINKQKNKYSENGKFVL